MLSFFRDEKNVFFIFMGRCDTALPCCEFLDTHIVLHVLHATLHACEGVGGKGFFFCLRCCDQQESHCQGKCQTEVPHVF